MSHTAPCFKTGTPPATLTDPINEIRRQINDLTCKLLDEGANAQIPKHQMPKWVWKNLGKALANSNINLTPLAQIAERKSCHREVLFQSETAEQLDIQTDIFSLVAITLSPGEATVTHDHFVDCGPLLVHGHITEFYGYSDQLTENKVKLALLPYRRELVQFEPAEYFSAEGQNTHRLKESTGNAPGVVINLYLEKEGNSVKDRYPFHLGTDPESGAEWWINNAQEQK
ncbi:hypothetical protein [Endozoicomonas ascidiicola]|uniref:hypothetical protein n=1 Tax=Endozoicomonas ascidiicola TaxID=1698521 RepID=UPI000AFC402F|nr:hypothetical protein [Endozoicomonas ascidiicola]